VPGFSLTAGASVVSGFSLTAGASVVSGFSRTVAAVQRTYPTDKPPRRGDTELHASHAAFGGSAD